MVVSAQHQPGGSTSGATATNTRIRIDQIRMSPLYRQNEMKIQTYLLDGIVISMGNPHESILREKLAAAAVAGG